MHAAHQLRQFLRAHEQGQAYQDALLLQLVRRHADTRFGRDHGLVGVRNYEDFRKAVPLGNYDTLQPYLKAVYEGDAAAMFPPGCEVLMFALTSGTTGDPKRIPVTRQALADYKRGWNVFGLRMLMDHPDAWLRKIIQISSPPAESYSPTGLPCGAISGLLAATQKRIVRSMYVVRPEMLALQAAVKHYTILRRAMPEDVAILSTANPSTVVQLFTTAQQYAEPLLRDLRDGTYTPPGEVPPDMASRLRLRKHPSLVRRIEAGMARDGGKLLCRHFWKLSVLTHWTGGTLGLYLPQVRRLTDNVPIRDIGLLASEGRFSVPLQDQTPEGVADITSSFLEFIPADEIGSPQPTVLRSHQLEVGQEYFLVLTNFSGLWRYNINDRIRVTGRLGQSPVFAFLSKGAHTVNLTGEKLTEHQVVQAVQQSSERLGFSVQRFLAQAHFDRLPYYSLTVESDTEGPSALAPAVDAALQELNTEYASKRTSGRLGPIRLTWASRENFSRREGEILRHRQGRTEQYKHQYLLTDIVNDAPAE